MLAPRNKLWSTPTEVMDVAFDLLDLSEEDILYDIGAGDGRFLMHCHLKAGCRCTGVEINEERAERARKDISEAGSLESHCIIITGNALEQVRA
jgi:cyclopropane fatty-acyl-phospholipid synthase-like methyltransferase